MMKRLKSILIALSVVVMAITVAVPATSQAALTSGFTSLNFQPAISNDTDYFGVYSSQNVGKRGWNTGFYLDWAKNPIEVGAPPGVRQAGIVNNTATGNFYATYGILDWLSVGINIPVIFWNDVNPVTAYGALGTFADNTFSTFDTQTNMGDVRLELKFRIRDNSERLIGVALVPFVNLPSGPSSTFAGAGALSGGIKAVLDFNIHDRVNLALNVGYLAHDRVVLRNAIVDDKLLVSLGLSIKLIDRLMFIAEGSIEPVITEFFENEVETPAEVRAGFRVKINENFSLNVGGGAGLTIGIGSPDWRAFLGLNYNWAPAPCEDCVVPAKACQIITIDQKVHFAFDRAVIRSQSYPILNDVAALVNGQKDSIQSITIHGHTDAIGSDAYNQSLSERRANAVKSYLSNKGVAANMTGIGHGESKPVATNSTAEGRAKNRRVEFVVGQECN